MMENKENSEMSLGMRIFFFGRQHVIEKMAEENIKIRIKKKGLI